MNVNWEKKNDRGRKDNRFARNESDSLSLGQLYYITNYFICKVGKQNG